MQKTIGGDDVVEGFGFALCIDGAAHVGQVAKNVESIELEKDFALHHPFCQSGVPYEFVGVHRVFNISSARISCRHNHLVERHF